MQIPYKLAHSYKLSVNTAVVQNASEVNAALGIEVGRRPTFDQIRQLVNKMNFCLEGQKCLPAPSSIVHNS